MKRLMDWIAGRCGYVPEACLRIEREKYEDARNWENLHFKAKSRYRKALNAIIAQDTPNSNTTVKRMVKIARDGLGGAA